MRAVTSSEKALLRGHQSSKFYLALLPKRVVYTARLASVPESADMVAQISFVSGNGTLTNVRPGMTLLVGSTPEDDDLGRVRIRLSPIAGTFYIGEQSHVKWVPNAYLTVIEDYDLWPRHLSMTGGNIKMDFDIPYTDQHQLFNPVPLLGSHRVAKLSGPSIVLNLGSDKDSWVFDSTISSYSWYIPSAVSIVGGNTRNPSVTFNQPGWHPCYCTVTASNGKSKTAMRWVYLWNSENPPIEVFGISNFIESLKDGGSSCQLTFYTDMSNIPRRAFGILFSDDYYGNINQSLGQVLGGENIRLVGRLNNESLEFNKGVQKVSAELQGYQYWFSKIPTYPVGIEIAKNTPTEWTSLPKLTVDRGLWHLLEWRTTAIGIMDIFLTGDSHYSPEMASYSGSLWEMMNEFIYSQILGHLGVNPQGQFFAERDPQLLSDRSGIIEVMDLTVLDYRGDSVTIENILVPEVSMIDLSGISIDQNGGSASSYFALSPGHVFGEYGSVEIIDRLLIQDQSECNTLAGLYYGFRSNPYPRIEVTLLANNFMVGVFPANYLLFTFSETLRGTQTFRMIPREILSEYSAEKGLLEIKVICEAESFEKNSVAYIPPEGDNISIPPLPSFPKLPDFTPLYPGDTSHQNERGPSTVVAVIRRTVDGQPGGIIYTKNFNADQPSQIIWQFWNNGLSQVDIETLNGFGTDFDMFFTPSGSCWLTVRPIQNYAGTLTSGYGGIYYSPALGATWVKIFGFEQLVEAYPGAAFYGIFASTFNPNKPEEIGILAGTRSPHQANIWIGNRSGFTKRAAHSIVINLWEGHGISNGNGWFFVNSHDWNSYLTVKSRFSIDGSTLEMADSVDLGSSVPTNLLNGGSQGIYLLGVSNGFMSVTNDLGDTFTSRGSNLDVGITGSYSCDPTGQYLLGAFPAYVRRGKSSDFGYSWSTLTNLIPGTYYQYAFAGGTGVESRWLAGYASIYYTPNAFGSENWEVRDGNLVYLTPMGRVFRRILIPGLKNQ
jgi:hypothetical protein